MGLTKKEKNIRKKVEKQLKGVDPQTTAKWFCQRSIILMVQSGMTKKEIDDYIDKIYKQVSEK